MNAVERRSDVRITPKGAVIVRADTYIIRGRVENLSGHGLLARTRITAPERLLGAKAVVALRLDGGGASWLELSGKVLRIGSGSLAIGLEIVPAGFTAIIDEAVSRSHGHDRAVAVVLVDPVLARRRAMADGFRAAGCVVVEASTPLEAIVRLGGAHFEPDLIAVAESIPASISDELRGFVDAEHPQAMLVSIGDTAGAPTQVGHWLSAADTGGELAARVRDMLTRVLPRL